MEEILDEIKKYFKEKLGDTKLVKIVMEIMPLGIIYFPIKEMYKTFKLTQVRDYYNLTNSILGINNINEYKLLFFVTILIILFIVILAMFLFFNTELGQALIATGDNPKMAISLGISTKKMTTIGLMLSNSMIALTGAILSQNNGYADVNSGLGVIVVALAAIIIGEVIFTDVNFLTRLVCIVFGSIIYRLLLVFVLKLNVIQANDFKMVSALLIAIFLSIPELKKLSLSKVGKGNK